MVRFTFLDKYGGKCVHVRLNFISGFISFDSISSYESDCITVVCFPVDQIQEVVTIEEVFNRKQGGNSDYAIIYGILTSFDLDAENTDRFFRRRWFVIFDCLCLS